MQNNYKIPHKSIFKIDGDGSEDDGTLYSLSCEFLEAARLMLSTPPTRINCESVTYYLLGHSIELMLKAFLCQNGMTIDELERVRHNLRKLITQAREKGLSEELSLSNAILLSNVYQNKMLEYRKRKLQTYPDLKILFQESDNLHSVVFDNMLSRS